MFVSSHPHLLFPVPNKPHGFRGRKAPCLLFTLKPAGSVNLDRGRLGLKPGVPQRPETERTVGKKVGIRVRRQAWPQVADLSDTPILSAA